MKPGSDALTILADAGPEQVSGPLSASKLCGSIHYAYGAFCPQDGASSHFILPAMDGYCMTYFLRHVRKEFPDDFILMVMDGAPCHKDGAMNMPENMMIQRLPPYSPELNPSENMWDDMREKFFRNLVFDSMEAVENKLCEAMNHYADNPKTVRSITAFPWIVSFDER